MIIIILILIVGGYFIFSYTEEQRATKKAIIDGKPTGIGAAE